MLKVIFIKIPEILARMWLEISQKMDGKSYYGKHIWLFQMRYIWAPDVTQENVSKRIKNRHFHKY